MKKVIRVIIIGGGNVAMDAARTCVRLGAESVTVAYRRSQEQMPALLSEYEEARAEGVQFQWFASPVAVEGKDKVEGSNTKSWRLTTMVQVSMAQVTSKLCL